MRGFLTGVSGWVGSAVLKELLGAGHTVLVLARSDSAAESFKDIAGVEVIRGSLTDLDVMAKGASSCDGVIHCVFIHIVKISDFPAALAADDAAIKVLTTAAKGPVVVTSGAAVIADASGRVGTTNGRRNRSHVGAAVF